VVLDPHRWVFHGDRELAGAERIIVGRPLWVRTMSPDAVVRYSELRNNPRQRRWRWLGLRRRPRQQRIALGATGQAQVGPGAVEGPTAQPTPPSSTAN
jgi:hypothetical protein